MEYRKHKRKPVELTISFAGENIVGKGNVCNLSQGGCAVLTPQKVTVGAFLELLIHMRGEQDLIKIDVAVVRYAIPDRFGLDFLQITPGDQQKLKQLLKSL